MHNNCPLCQNICSQYMSVAIYQWKQCWIPSNTNFNNFVFVVILLSACSISQACLLPNIFKIHHDLEKKISSSTMSSYSKRSVLEFLPYCQSFIRQNILFRTASRNIFQRQNYYPSTGSLKILHLSSPKIYESVWSWCHINISLLFLKLARIYIYHAGLVLRNYIYLMSSK
jgi:hypothetical protein